MANEDKPGLREPALDYGPVPLQAVAIHCVQALDRLAIVPAHDADAAGGPVKRASDRICALGPDVELPTRLTWAFVARNFFVTLNIHKTLRTLTLLPRFLVMIEPPSNIRALQAQQILEVTWPDGQTDRFPYRFLRGHCPCASCRDEWTGERIIREEAIAPDLKLEGMEPIGTYALQLAWSDGHSSGLYTWELLRQISALHHD